MAMEFPEEQNLDEDLPERVELDENDPIIRELAEGYNYIGKISGEMLISATLTSILLLGFLGNYVPFTSGSSFVSVVHELTGLDIYTSADLVSKFHFGLLALSGSAFIYYLYSTIKESKKFAIEISKSFNNKVAVTKNVTKIPVVPNNLLTRRGRIIQRLTISRLNEILQGEYRRAERIPYEEL